MSSHLPPHTPATDALLTAADAARLLRLSLKHVQRLAKAGELPALRAGRRWLFRRDDLLVRLGDTGRPAARRDGLALSARNQLPARVVRLTLDRVSAEVELRVGDQTMVSLISRASAERLALRVGQEVIAVIKATEIMIGRR